MGRSDLLPVPPNSMKYVLEDQNGEERDTKARAV